MIGTVVGMATVMLSYALILPSLGLEMNRGATSSITALSVSIMPISDVHLRGRASSREIFVSRISIESFGRRLTGSIMDCRLVPGCRVLRRSPFPHSVGRRAG
jgi:hypothetical protein